MSLHLSFQLNGKKTPCEEGHTVLQAALEAGVDLPHLCAAGEGGGSCRLCTVRVDGRPVSACSVEARQRMVVESDDAALERNRRVLLALMLLEAGMENPSEALPESSHLHGLVKRYAVKGGARSNAFSEPDEPVEHPDLTLNTARCVRCGACVRQVRSAQGEAVFYRTGHGSDMKISADRKVRVAHAEQAAAVCPAGALSPTCLESPNQ